MTGARTAVTAGPVTGAGVGHPGVRATGALEQRRQDVGQETLESCAEADVVDAAELADPTIYGRQWAQDYDDIDTPSPEQTAAAVDFLAALAAGGSVLELAAGTGRVAVPLAGRVGRVVASDVSPHMLAVLAGKDPAGAVEVRIEDMATRGVPEFDVVALLLNSLWAGATQAHQQETFHAAASRLHPGGRLVLEMVVPDLSAPVQHVAVRDDVEMFLRRRWEPATQRLVISYLIHHGDAVSRRRLDLRVVWPGEADLMAHAAGLSLEGRFSGWGREPLAPGYGNVVSVYRRR